MSATTLTAKAVKKTTVKKAPKAKGPPVPGRFTFWLDKKMTEASGRYEAALASSEGFPAIRSVVEAWSPMHLETARLDAAHSALEEEADADGAALDAANDAWMSMLSSAEEVSSSVLDLPATTAREAQAKIDTLYAMQGYKVRSEIHDDGTGNLVIAAMRRDLDLLATIASAHTRPDSGAWTEALSTWRALESSDDFSEEATDACAAADCALIQTPAPDLSAVLIKLEHGVEMLLTGRDGMNAEIARGWLDGGDWLSKCIGAVYLDIQRMIGFTGSGLDLDLVALGEELERLWLFEDEVNAEGSLVTDAEQDANHAAASAVAESIRQLPATTLAGLRVKARAALWCQGDRRSTFHLLESRVCDSSLAASVVRDILAQPAGLPALGADAGIVQAALKFRALSDEYDSTGNDRVGGPNKADQRRMHELSEAKQPVLDYLMAHPATTLDGFRAKALVARWYAPTAVLNDYEDLEWKVHRTLTDDLLASGQLPSFPDDALIGLSEHFIDRRRAWCALVNSPDFDDESASAKVTTAAYNAAYAALVDKRAATPSGVVALVLALRATQCADVGADTFDPTEVPHFELMRAVCDSAWALRSGDEALPPGTERWRAARDLFTNARSAEAQIDQELEQLTQDLKARYAPIPPELLHETGTVLLPSDLEGHPDEARLTELRDAWHTLYGAACSRAGVASLDKAASLANTRTYHAMMAYLQTPPVDLLGLSAQLRDALNFDVVPHGVGSDIDTVEAMRAVLNDDESSTNYLGMAYQHVLRLLGEDSPILSCRRDYDQTQAEQVTA